MIIYPCAASYLAWKSGLFPEGMDRRPPAEMTVYPEKNGNRQAQTQVCSGFIVTQITTNHASVSGA